MMILYRYGDLQYFMLQYFTIPTVKKNSSTIHDFNAIEARATVLTGFPAYKIVNLDL
jgi:hypothetical protein